MADVPDTDLGFLADLPPLRALTIVLSGVRDVSALAHHADTLESAHIELGLHPVDVDSLGDLPRLRELYLRKDGRAAVKGAPEAIARATALEHLVLHGITLPSIALLTGMPRLQGLALKLGSAPDMADFPRLPALRFFEAWQVRGLRDITSIAASPTLEVLFLDQNLGSATLPNFSQAMSLAHVHFTRFPLSGDLADLAAAPALRQVSIGGRSFDREEVAVLRDHPTLQAAFVRLRGRATEDEMTLGLSRPNRAPWTAFGAGVMGLPPEGWDGEYIVADEPSGGAPV
jgi:hypothetical protein